MFALPFELTQALQTPLKAPMKAIVLESKEAGIVVRTDYPKPIPTTREVLVRLHTAALNHRDVWINRGQYAGLRYPSILGSDGVGTVEAFGEGVSEAVQAEWLHQTVLINPNQNWGTNEAAQSKAYTVLGMPHNGTLAEYTAVPLDRLHKKPAFLTNEQAAALPLAGLTAYRALFVRAGLAQYGTSERVLISGAGGGVALFALQMAVAAGAGVYATSSSETKRGAAIALGAKDAVDYTDPNWHRAFVATHGKVDIVIDSAGGDGFAKFLDVLNPGGRVVFYGGGVGTINGLSPQKIFWGQLSLLGSTMGSDADFAAMLAFVEQHQIVPVIDSTFSIEEAKAAFARMEAGAQFGKIVVTM